MRLCHLLPIEADLVLEVVQLLGQFSDVTVLVAESFVQRFAGCSGTEAGFRRYVWRLIGGFRAGSRLWGRGIGKRVSLFVCH